jgi:hypothetical protein
MGYRKFRDLQKRTMSQSSIDSSAAETNRLNLSLLEKTLRDPESSLTHEINECGGYNAFVRLCRRPKQRKAPRARGVFDE